MARWAQRLPRARPSLGRRAAILIAPAFVGGAAAYMSLAKEPDPWMALSGVLAAALFAALGRHVQALRWPAIWLLASALGFGWALASARLAEAPRLAAEGAGMLTGVAAWIEADASRPRLELTNVVFERYGEAVALERARVRLAGGARPSVGDTVELRAVMRPPPDAVAPGAFDFRRDAYFKGIGAVGFAIGAVETVKAAPGGVEGWFGRARAGLRDAVYRALPDRPATAGVIAALTVGDRSGVSESDDDALRASGLAHLLAISGLHLGLAASAVYLALRLGFALPHGLALRAPAHKLAAVAAILAAAFYLGLSGAAPPAQRAFVMVVAGMVAILTDRLRSGLWFVAWAAVVVTAAAPHVVVGPSFQLSFAAATAIVAAYEVIAARRREAEGPAFAGAGALRPVVAYVAGLLGASLIATAATAPLALIHFQQAPLFGVVANLAAMPAMAFVIMPSAIVAGLAAPFGFADFPLSLMGYGVEFVLYVAHLVASWDGGVVRTPAVGAWPAAAFLAGGALICALRGWMRLLGLPAVAAAIACLVAATAPDLLVNREGRIAAVVRSDALYVTTMRAGRFERDVWRRHVGAPEVKSLEEAGDWAQCDDRGCALALTGGRVAFSFRSEGLQDDCQRADLVIALGDARPTPAMGCDPAKVLDGGDFYRGGAHAVRMTSDGFIVETVRAVAGERPWSLQ